MDKLKLILADNDDDEKEEEAKGAPVKAAQKDAPMPAFTIKLDDPSGNSFIEFVQSMSDPKWNLRTYHRTREQNVALGLVAEDQAPEEGDGKQLESVAEGAEGEGEGEEGGIGGGADGQNEEIFVFKGICSSCGHDLDTLMKKVSIPYFKVRFLYPSRSLPPTLTIDRVDSHTAAYIMNRTSSSCRQIATDADTETTKSNPAPPSQTMARKSH